MNTAVAEYRQHFSRCLRCGAKEKKRLLEQFDKALIPFLEEYPTPSEYDLEYAFGSPAQLADSYLAPVSKRPAAQRRTVRRAVVALAIVLVGLVLAWAAAIPFGAANTSDVHETVPPQTMSA